MAVVSPCSPVVFWWEHRAAQARSYLESLGLRVRVMPHTGQSMAGKRVAAPSRADDLHAAFSDPDVAVVLAAIGGDHAVELLPHLDYQLIRANPKLFQGYSDLTVLQWALLKHAGLMSFYGPALLPELGEGDDPRRGCRRSAGRRMPGDHLPAPEGLAGLARPPGSTAGAGDLRRGAASPTGRRLPGRARRRRSVHGFMRRPSASRRWSRRYGRVSRLLPSKDTIANQQVRAVTASASLHRADELRRRCATARP